MKVKGKNVVITKILAAVANENNKQMKELREFTRRRKSKNVEMPSQSAEKSKNIYISCLKIFQS